MKLKFLLWIAAAIAAVVVGVFVFTSKDEKPEQVAVEVVEPTTETEGEKFRVCAECPARETEKIPVHVHTYGV